MKTLKLRALDKRDRMIWMELVIISQQSHFLVAVNDSYKPHNGNLLGFIRPIHQNKTP